MNDCIKKIYVTSPEREIKSDHSKGVDVIVELNNGRKYAASFFSIATICHLKFKKKLHEDKYLWVKNMVISRDNEYENIVSIVSDLIDEGDFYQAFSKLN